MLHQMMLQNKQKHGSPFSDGTHASSYLSRGAHSS